MAEKIISPGVFTNEIDQSFLPAASGPVGAAVVGPTVKGPALTPTVVNSYGEYVNLFGEVIESGSDSYQFLTSHTAKEYLRQGGPLTVVRVTGTDTVRSNASVSTVGTFVAGLPHTSSMTFAAVPSGSDIGSPDELKIGGVDFTYVSSSVGYTNTVNQVFVTHGNTPTNTAQNTALALTSTTSTTGLLITTASSAAGLLQITASAALTVTTGSGDDATAITLSFVAPVNVSGGTISSVAGSTLFTLEALGDGPEFNNTSSLGTDQILTPLRHSATNNHFGSGSLGGRGNNFRWEVSSQNTTKGTFTLLIRQGNDTIKKKKIIETHSNLSLDPGSNDYVLKRIGNQTNTIATENGVAYLQPVGEFPNRSNYVRVSSLADVNKTPNWLDENGDVNTPYNGSETSYLPGVGSGSYAGSFNGGFFGQTEVEHPFNFYENINASNSQGVDMSVSATGVGTNGYATALSLLSNKDEYSFNLLMLPGVIDQETDHSVVIGQAIQLCEDRGDCFLVYDNTELTDNVATAKTNTEARNSSYAATYYPWVQIQDTTTGNFRFVPPSVVMAGVYHFNDVVGQPWFAPAGLNRGGIDSAVRAYRKLTQANRDDLYDSNSNPIASFPGQGVTVFGQKTTQKKASALDRVNVRRLLINLKTFVASSSRGLVFEQNTSNLRNQFLNVVNPYMEQVQSNQGLNAFRVVMDDSNNTPETIDRNMLVGQIFLQPTKTAEFIVLDFVVQPTGAAFPE